MNCLETILSRSTRWTRALADEVYQNNKSWADSPAGLLGWRFPVQQEFSHAVDLNRKIQHHLIQLGAALDNFKSPASKDDWFEVEAVLDQLRTLVTKLKCYTDENLEDHVGYFDSGSNFDNSTLNTSIPVAIA